MALLGEMEAKSRQRARKKNVQKAILQLVKGVGILSASLVAPQVLRMFGRMQSPRTVVPSIYRARKSLIERGFLRSTNGGLEITLRGEQLLRSLEVRDHSIKHPKKWDERWRVIIFDVPERRRLIREKVRRTLQHIGFVRLQDSVWLYPYECEEFITLLKADFHIGKDILYMIVDTLENDKKYRRHFGLRMT